MSATDYLPVALTFAAALMSSWASWRVTQLSSDTDRMLGELQHSIEEAQVSIKRAELFKELVRDLHSPEYASYALLTLWNMYNEEEDRRIIVLAALENPKAETIATLQRLGLEGDLVDLTVNTLLKSGATDDMVTKLPAEIKFPVLWRQLSTDRQVEDVTPMLQEIAVLAETNSGVQYQLDEEWDKPDQAMRAELALIDHMAGNPDKMALLLSRARFDDSVIPSLSKIMEPEYLVAMDAHLAKLLLMACIDYLQGDDAQAWFPLFLIHEADPEVLTLNANERIRLETTLNAFIRQHQLPEDDFLHELIKDSLAKWSPDSNVS